jgi:hypothetical protein
MRRLVEFPLEGGGTVLVEVTDGEAATTVTRGWGNQGAVSVRAEQSFEQAIGRVQPAVQALLAQLRGMQDEPDEVVVEFGIEIAVEAGAFIASASSAANFKVSLVWRSSSGSASVPSQAIPGVGGDRN